jgi:hypothetical protein
VAEAAFNNNRILYTNKLDINLMRKLVVLNVEHSFVLFGAETGTLGKVDRKYV